MGTKRMRRTEFGKLIFDKRGHPIPVSLVDLPGEPNEGHKILAAFNLFNT
jgi:hypothetical protein